MTNPYESFTPTTDAIRGIVAFGFATLFKDSGNVAVVADSAVEDFDRWLKGEQARVYQEALEAVQVQINENVPITAESVFRVVNPYV